MISAVLSVALLTQQPITIVQKGKIGDTYRYSFVSEFKMITGDPGSVHLSGNFREKLTKVEGGLFYWETEFYGTKTSATENLKASAEYMARLDGMVVTMVSDNRGRLLKTLHKGVQVASNQGSSAVVLPPSGTKIGSTWVAPFHVGSKSVKITYKLASIKGNVATITGSYQPGQGVEAIEPTIFTVDTSNGKMISGIALTQATENGLVVNATYKITRF